MDPVKQPERPDDQGDRTDAGPYPGDAGLEVNAEAQHTHAYEHESPQAKWQNSKPVGGKQQASSRAEGGDPDASGEELERGQQQADDEQQVGDGWTGHGVQ